MATHKATCSACGRKTNVNKAALEARIKKFGTEEEMNKKWKCRECSKGTKAKASA